jgi:hypothetical protein
LERWIVGSPYTISNNLLQVQMVSLIRESTYTDADRNNCGDKPMCILMVQPMSLTLPQ